MLATEISDPGIGLVTVTRVKVTADLSLARVYWTLMGGPAERKQTTKALRRAAPYLRHLLAGRMSLRRVPEVAFTYDEGVAAQDRVEQLIQQIHQEDAERQAAIEPARGAAEAENASDTTPDPGERSADRGQDGSEPEAGAGADETPEPKA